MNGQVAKLYPPRLAAGYDAPAVREPTGWRPQATRLLAVCGVVVEQGCCVVQGPSRGKSRMSYSWRVLTGLAAGVVGGFAGAFVGALLWRQPSPPRG